MSKQKRSNKTDNTVLKSKKTENILAFAKLLLETAKLIWEIISRLSE